MKILFFASNHQIIIVIVSSRRSLYTHIYHQIRDIFKLLLYHILYSYAAGENPKWVIATYSMIDGISEAHELQNKCGFCLRVHTMCL